MEAGHRSIHPNLPGVPWWGALLIATIATAVGYAIDAASDHKELTHVFAGFYIAGCVAAVLAVRQEGVFTAIIQPPLILFCAVPGAYWLFHGGKVGGVKDLLINCGYPLIERFPLMLGTAGAVLLIGMVRWYFGKSRGTAVAADITDDAATASPARSNSIFNAFLDAVGPKLNSLLRLHSRADDADDAASGDATGTRDPSAPRKAKSGRPARRTGSRPGRAHSRHARPLGDEDEPGAERPRRRRQAPPPDFDPADPPRRSRRRPRPQGDPELRGRRESRPDSRQARANPYERPYEGSYEGTRPRSSRFEGYDRYDPPPAPEQFNRYEPYEPRRRRAPGGNGANPTHHPISQVRYRGSGPLDEPRAPRGAEPPADPRPERRNRSRSGRSEGRSPTESWEYEG